MSEQSIHGLSWAPLNLCNKTSQPTAPRAWLRKRCSEHRHVPVPSWSSWGKSFSLASSIVSNGSWIFASGDASWCTIVHRATFAAGGRERMVPNSNHQERYLAGLLELQEVDQFARKIWRKSLHGLHVSLDSWLPSHLDSTTNFVTAEFCCFKRNLVAPTVQNTHVPFAASGKTRLPLLRGSRIVAPSAIEFTWGGWRHPGCYHGANIEPWWQRKNARNWNSSATWY